MSNSDFKARLLAARNNERSIELPGIGTVKVRGLTRAEVMGLKGKFDPQDVVAHDVWILATAMVEPALTRDEVVQWYEVASMEEIQTVINAALQVGGMGDSSDKDAYKSV